MQHRPFQNQFATCGRPDRGRPGLAPHSQSQSIFTPGSGSIQPAFSGPNLDATCSDSTARFENLSTFLYFSLSFSTFLYFLARLICNFVTPGCQAALLLCVHLRDLSASAVSPPTQAGTCPAFSKISLLFSTFLYPSLLFSTF